MSQDAGNGAMATSHYRVQVRAANGRQVDFYQNFTGCQFVRQGPFYQSKGLPRAIKNLHKGVMLVRTLRSHGQSLDARGQSATSGCISLTVCQLQQVFGELSTGIFQTLRIQPLYHVAMIVG